MLIKKISSLLFVLFIIFLVIAGCEEEAADESEPVAGEVTLDSALIEELVYTNHFISDIDMELFWEFSLEEEELYMVLKSPGSGWLAIGFEPTNRMADAQMIIAGFENEGFILEEHYGTGPTTHEKIDETYIENSSGERTAESSRIEFVIPLGVESRYDLQQGEEYTIILSYHNSSDNFLQRHSQRTTIEVEL